MAKETIVIDGVRYYADRPTSCRGCFFWKNRKAGYDVWIALLSDQRIKHPLPVEAIEMRGTLVNRKHQTKPIPPLQGNF